MRITAIVSSALVLVLFGCSSEPAGDIRGGSSPTAPKDDGDGKQTRGGTAGTARNTGNTGSSNNTGGTGTASPGSQPPGTSTPAPATVDPATCAAKADWDSCWQCCNAAAPGAMKLLGEKWFECACAPEKCATQCGQTACAATPKEPQQGDACDTCLAQQDDACMAVADQACNADASCAKVMQCGNAAKCAEKPL